MAQDFAVLGAMSVAGMLTGWQIILQLETLEGRWRAALTRPRNAVST